MSQELDLTNLKCQSFKPQVGLLIISVVNLANCYLIRLTQQGSLNYFTFIERVIFHHSIFVNLYILIPSFDVMM